ncbi:MAG: hypothetical protein Q8M71_04640 [Thermodesulfovibrionales bacterium]|nr:hypothetical protein [Thermodesulfovibrionales bacterium]
MKKYKISLLVVAVFMFSLFSSTAFAVPDDSIVSQHIKEADGTTGQDTNTGSGIKTGHIQDGAVTTGKIVDGSVTTPKITDNAVTTPKVADGSITTNKVVDGAITTPKIVDGAVSTSKITDGAVTDAKIIGPISGSKLGTHTHSGSDIADGSVTTSKIAAGAITPDKVGFYNNVIIVAKSGGDFTSPVNAMNAITDASASNPYLIKIMPGIYPISSSLRMKPYVDIEGSGQTVTKIVGDGLQTAMGTGACEGSGVVIGGVAAEIRSLTIENNADAGQVNVGYYACRWFFGHTQKLTNLTINTSGGSSNFAIFNNSDSPIITNVIVSATGPGSNYGILNVGAAVMRDLVVTGTMTNIAACTGCETVRCLGVYDANYDPIQCP